MDHRTTPAGQHPDLPSYLTQLTQDAQDLVHAVHADQRSYARRLYTRALRRAAPAGVDPAEAIALTLAGMADPAFRRIAATPRTHRPDDGRGC